MTGRAPPRGPGRPWHRLAWLAGPMALSLLPALARAGDTGRGAELYRQHCVQCHGPGGRPVLPGTPDLSRPTALLKPDPALLQTIRQGRGAMPGYQGQLRDREILDIVTHLRLLR